MLAETNRHPFDLPEAESELVSGYNVEYSGMSFALFFLGEYSAMFFMSSLSAILFMGGWFAIPGIVILFIEPFIFGFYISLNLYLLMNCLLLLRQNYFQTFRVLKNSNIYFMRKYTYCTRVVSI